MTLLLGIITVFTVFLLLLLLSIHLKTSRQGNRLMNHANSLLDSRMSQFIMGLQNDFIVAVDTKRQIYVYADPLKEFVFHYDSVLAVTLVKDNKIVSECLSAKMYDDEKCAHYYSQNKAKLMLTNIEGDSSKNNSSIKVYISLSDENNSLLEIECFNSKTHLFAGRRTQDLTKEESQLYRRGLQIGYHIVMLMNKSMNAVDTVLDK